MTVNNLRSIFKDGKNLMEALREGDAHNSQEAIMLSYDLQAGSYSQMMIDSEVMRANKSSYGVLMSDILQTLHPISILDAGVGEATSLYYIIDKIHNSCMVYAFDISLSRLLFAKKFLKDNMRQDICLFTAALDNIPIESASIDTVITHHAIEPNGGRELELVKELIRVAGRYIVMVEPSWELGSSDTRLHIEKHGYIKNLPNILLSMGATIIRHELWPNNINPKNEAALIVAKVPDCDRWISRPATLRSPIGYGVLEDRGDYLYSREDGFIFPKAEGIPCLLEDNGILAAQLDKALATAP